MGSGYKSFTAGAVLTASDVNNYLMEQGVMYFATTAARDAALSASLEDGMTVYQGTNDASEGLWCYNGSGWARPWNMPWGSVAVSASSTSKITTPPLAGSAKANTGLTITTGTLPANRILKHTVTGMVFFASVNDMIRISIVTGSSGGTDLMEADYAPFGTANAYSVSFSFFETTTSTAALTRRITQERIVGTSNDIQFFCDATRPATYIIEDIGPSGAPA